MAQIDELIAAMMARRADALILISDESAQLNFGGRLAKGAVVPAALLRNMLDEILPDDQKLPRVKPNKFEFVHLCSSGFVRVQVTRRDTHISLAITPHQTSSSQSPQFSPIDAYYAPYRAPDLSKSGATGANSTQNNSVQKPRIGAVSLICAIFAYAIGLRILTALLGTSLPWAFFLLAAVGILADASSLGVRKGLVDGWADLDPWQWFLLCMVLNFIGIPAYLVARPVYKSVLPPARVPPP